MGATMKQEREGEKKKVRRKKKEVNFSLDFFYLRSCSFEMGANEREHEYDG